MEVKGSAPLPSKWAPKGGSESEGGHSGTGKQEPDRPQPGKKTTRSPQKPKKHGPSKSRAVTNMKEDQLKPLSRPSTQPSETSKAPNSSLDWNFNTQNFNWADEA